LSPPDQAVILAGGLGTRLAPLTQTLPKALVPVRGRPFLDHLLEHLHQQGFGEVVLLVGHLGMQISQRYGHGAPCTPRLVYSHDEPPRGTLGALVKARDLLEPTFLLLNGDTYLDVDYRQVLAAADGSAADALVVAARATDCPPNLRVAADDFTVTAYRKTGLDRGTHVAAGALVLRRAIVEDYGARVNLERASLEHDVLPSLALEGRMLAFVTERPFFDIGTPAGLTRFAHHLGG
jgi:D-glycero-alpha-D-manno-heptose 1-phosphate guanylyltransferase